MIKIKLTGPAHKLLFPEASPALEAPCPRSPASSPWMMDPVEYVRTSLGYRPLQCRLCAWGVAFAGPYAAEAHSFAAHPEAPAPDLLHLFDPRMDAVVAVRLSAFRQPSGPPPRPPPMGPEPVDLDESVMILDDPTPPPAHFRPPPPPPAFFAQAPPPFLYPAPPPFASPAPPPEPLDLETETLEDGADGSVELIDLGDLDRTLAPPPADAWPDERPVHAVDLLEESVMEHGSESEPLMAPPPDEPSVDERAVHAEDLLQESLTEKDSQSQSTEEPLEVTAETLPEETEPEELAEETSEPTGEASTSGDSAVTMHAEAPPAEATRSPSQETPDRPSLPRPPVFSRSRASSPWMTCGICQEQLKRQKTAGSNRTVGLNHVAAKHYKKPMWSCGRCGFSSCATNSGALNSHLKGVHKLAADAFPANRHDHRARHQRKLNKLYLKAFGDFKTSPSPRPVDAPSRPSVVHSKVQLEAEPLAAAPTKALDSPPPKASPTASPVVGPPPSLAPERSLPATPSPELPELGPCSRPAPASFFDPAAIMREHLGWMRRRGLLPLGLASS